MRDLLAFLTPVVLFGTPATYILWLLKADRARLAKGSTPFARFRTSETKVQDVARLVHEAIRADLIARLGVDDTDIQALRARVHELAATGLVVSPDVATPPGPVRVLLEERKPGDLPGMRAVIFVRRDGNAKDGYELEIRGDRPRLFGVPRRQSALFLDALDRALRSAPNVVELEWSADGKHWSAHCVLPAA